MTARQFTDSSSVTWEVFEVRRSAGRSGSVSPGLESGWLTFTAGLQTRRLAGYPEGWWSLSDPELELLCMDARPSTPLIRSRPADAVPLASAPPADTPFADAAEVADLSDDEIMALARQCRAAGLTAVAAMLKLKRLLVERGITAATAAHKAARRLFVETFYFDAGR
ncbi:MAG: hypothetical protein JWL60_1138 [Gemmatimonadetes bacterium]|nr:hypothetical protein [Gemmatimonadota bacterium]